MLYALGLDIGSESVGWSVVELDGKDEPIKLVRLGVRTFDVVHREEAAATTPAQERRVARSQRRRLRNQRRRIRRLSGLLQRIGLVKNSAELQELLVTRPDDASPWELRVEALDRPLESREWARVLYHLVRHRGFKAIRRGDLETQNTKEKEKLGLMLSSVKAIHEGWLEKYRTVAEYMESPEWREKHGTQKRNRGGTYVYTIGREDLIHEARTLFESQRRLGNPFASAETENEYMQILDEPPHLLEGEELMKRVGFCFLEPTERRAPKATLTAQQFVALQRLANQSLVSRDGFTTRRLTRDEMELLMEEATKVEKLTYKRALKALGLESDWLFVINGQKRGKKLEELQGETLIRLESYHTIRKTLEKDFPDLWERLQHDRDYFDEIASVLTYYLQPESAVRVLENLGLEPEAARCLAQKAIFDGHAKLSLKAMRALIPYLKEGQTYDKAAELAGYVHYRPPVAEKTSTIPPLENLEGFTGITNPNVRRAINQARKVVNAIVREYGLPSRIGLELARDAAKSRARRKEEENRIRENQRDKERRFEHIRELAPDVDPEKVWKKHLLYEQQGGKCAYSLKDLDLKRVLTDPTYTEVDHIIPRSVCFDNSLQNQVLVLAEENRNKGDQLAAAYVRSAHGEKHYEQHLGWVASCHMPLRKKQFLRTTELTEEQKKEMQQRYLTATQYASRCFLGVLRQYFDIPENRIIPVNGRITADMRWLLGLPEKEREGSDVHHAIDATMAALADHRTVHRMAEYFKTKETTFRDPEGRWVTPDGEIVEPPKIVSWPRLREDLLTYCDALFVSRMPNRRVTGKGHKDTIYSLRHTRRVLDKLPERGKVSLPSHAPRPTQRVSLTALTDQQIREILKEPSSILVDETNNKRLYDLIRERLRAAQDKEGKGSWAERAFGADAEPLRMPTNDGSEGPIVRGIRVHVSTLSGVAVRGGVAESDTIVRLDIYRKVDARGKTRHYVVPVYAADLAAGWCPRKAATAHKPESEWPEMDKSYDFLFSLYTGDCFRVWQSATEAGPYLYMTSFDRSSVRISGNLPDRSNRNAEGKIQPVRVSVTTAYKVEKFEVDLLGNLHLVRKEPRPL